MDELDLKRQCTSYDMNDHGINIFDCDEDFLEDSDRKIEPYDVYFTTKATGVQRKFKCYDEHDLAFLRKQMKDCLFSFNKNTQFSNRLDGYPLYNLEPEYDYESDLEQVYTAKKHMVNESYLAIEFSTKDDPIVLVENLQPENETFYSKKQ